MGRRTFMLTWILVLCLPMLLVHSQYYSQSQPFDTKTAKVTNLHFFLHETLGGTAVMVAQANMTATGNEDNSNSSVARLFVVDDPLKIGPEEKSEVIGNVQGMASRIEATTMMYFDFGFTNGYFNGSSLSVFSRFPLTEMVTEVAVVGGRGKFKMATGFALVKLYFVNPPTVILEFNVTVVHY